jgi:hypothetical protein
LVDLQNDNPVINEAPELMSNNDELDQITNSPDNILSKDGDKRATHSGFSLNVLFLTRVKKM